MPEREKKQRARSHAHRLSYLRPVNGQGGERFREMSGARVR
jgi:hypothetical protein